MDGTWIWSGRISPTGTMSSTSTMVTFAALHITALKFRAVLRKTQVAPGVGLPRLHEGEVRLERQLEQVLAPVDVARLLALGDCVPTPVGV